MHKRNQKQQEGRRVFEAESLLIEFIQKVLGLSDNKYLKWSYKAEMRPNILYSTPTQLALVSGAKTGRGFPPLFSMGVEH